MKLVLPDTRGPRSQIDASISAEFRGEGVTSNLTEAIELEDQMRAGSMTSIAVGVKDCCFKIFGLSY